MKVYGPKDRFKVSIEGQGVSFILAPLTAKQKGEVLASLSNKGGLQIQDRWNLVRTALKYGVKGWEGITDSEDKPLPLPLDADGNLTDEGMDLIYALGDGKDPLQVAMLKVLNERDPTGPLMTEEGVAVEGVTIVHSGKV